MSVFMKLATEEGMPLVFELTVEVPSDTRYSGTHAAIMLSKARAELRDTYPDKNFDFVPYGYVLQKAAMQPRFELDACCCRYMAIEH